MLRRRGQHLRTHLRTGSPASRPSSMTIVILFMTARAVPFIAAAILCIIRSRKRLLYIRHLNSLQTRTSFAYLVPSARTIRSSPRYSSRMMASTGYGRSSSVGGISDVNGRGRSGVRLDSHFRFSMGIVFGQKNGAGSGHGNTEAYTVRLLSSCKPRLHNSMCDFPIYCHRSPLDYITINKLLYRIIFYLQNRLNHVSRGYPTNNPL